VEVKRELRLLVEANVESEEDDEVRVEFEKRASVWLLKSDGVRVDEELKTPDNVGKAEELLKGVGVSVSEDVDADDDDDSAEDVVDGAPSVRSGIETERDTLGNALSRAVRAAPAAAVISNVVCGGSEVRVWILVTAPVASM